MLQARLASVKRWSAACCYSDLQAGKLRPRRCKLLVLALQELGSGKLIKPIIA